MSALRHTAWLHTECCDSTQALAREWVTSLDLPVNDSALRAAPGDHTGDDPHVAALFSTDSQRTGLGREGRTWHDPPGSAAMFSLAVALPRIEADEHLARRVAEQARDTLGAAGASAAEVREPNDLYIDGRKIGGVLVDAQTVEGSLRWLIAGIGINLTGAPFEAGSRSATSVQHATGLTLGATDVILAIVDRLQLTLGFDS